MVCICKSNQKCRSFGEYFPATNLLRFGLLISGVFVTLINVTQVGAIECGTVNLYREVINDGKVVVKDEWPFIAALYYSLTSKYFCGGTIITRKHVLTAAHCIQRKFIEVKLLPDEVTVRLGAYNLTDRSEKDAVNRSVAEIHVHPDWKFNEEKYNADVAILVLNESVPFSDHIRPVCMPPANFLLDGLPGTVVGWGRTENGTAEGIPRKIEVNALSDTYCYDKDEGIASYASERSYCGEGSGAPNDGDSGGGFFAVDGSGWVQFGTVSFVRPKATENTLKVALYMKLSSLRQWIADKVEESGDKISVATTKANLKCTYGQFSDTAYRCWLFDLNIRQENFVVENFTGLHHSGKGNEDVEQIAFKSGVMASLPRNFGTIFKNLKFLEVSVDTRRIFRSNLQNLTHLETIQFVNSKIEELDEESLWDLPNLFSFRLEKSEVELLHVDTFSRNSDLTIVQILLNALKSLPRNLFRNNSELLVVNLSNNLLKTIDEQTFKTNSKLLALNLESNRLEFLPARLLQKMVSLEDVYLDNNALKSLDEQFFETNAGLKEISLFGNQLKTIPTNLFRNNSQLRTLQVSFNYIETIDENLFEENSLLQKISFESNSLVELPGNLFKQNALLEFVNFRGNSLEIINERIFEWNTRLREVNFSSNYVSSLPVKLFEKNFLLETVRFDFNSLALIDERTFQTNAKLQEVFLKSNLIQYLPANLFRHNPLLRNVDLSQNLFTTLNENIFSSNANLGKISLRSGLIELLPRHLFHGNSRLEYIDLRESDLRIIETNFTELEHVSYIDLSGTTCINAIYYDVISDTDKFSNGTRWPKWTRNLTEFQDLVTANCHP